MAPGRVAPPPYPGPLRAWAEIPPDGRFFIQGSTKPQVNGQILGIYKGGEGQKTTARSGYPAPHPDFFIATKMEVGYATVTERPKQALGFTVACNANSFTKYPRTGYRFTVMYDANYLTKRLETGYRFSVTSDANSFTERPDSGGARQHHSPMQDR